MAMTSEEWERFLDEAADLIDPSIPPLSDYALSREGMYEERVAQILGDDYDR